MTNAIGDHGKPTQVSAKNAENYTTTGPGTLAGRYLRTFWQPIYVADDLPAGRAVPLRIMSEDFTLYRGEGGTPHLVAPRCPHRLTRLNTGWVEGDSIRCFYHGWKYGENGQCEEAPAERDGFADRIKIASYPTQEYLGLIFAYLGEGDPPPFRRYPHMEGPGVILSSSYVRDCNYAHNLDNSMDEVHVLFVHRVSPNAREGITRELPEVSGEETEYGIARFGKRSDGLTRVQHFYWPNTAHLKLRVNIVDTVEIEQAEWPDVMLWWTPIDDESHITFTASRVHIYDEALQPAFVAREKERRQKMAELSPVREVAQSIMRGETQWPEVEDRPDIAFIQDYVAQVGQGAPDHAAERLGRSDAVVAIVRRIFARELKAFAAGEPLKEWRIPEDVKAVAGTLGRQASVGA